MKRIDRQIALFADRENICLCEFARGTNLRARENKQKVSEMLLNRDDIRKKELSRSFPFTTGQGFN